ncbi:MAG: hypothetical protein GYB67_12235 [Chloroflexi bacterium]|nr:hypothetical protein [Chloroflexota bacterium]
MRRSIGHRLVFLSSASAIVANQLLVNYDVKLVVLLSCLMLFSSGIGMMLGRST